MAAFQRRDFTGMKIKTSTIIWLIVGFIWSLFMGITFVSLGLGSIFPALNTVAQPFVCPGSQMQVRSQNYQVSPVESVTTLTWYCVDEKSGTQTEVNPFTINLYAGSWYGLLIFAALLIIWYFSQRWNPSQETAGSRKRVAWIQAIAVITMIVGVTLFNLMPLFRSAAPESAPIPDATATSLALTYEALISGAPSDFNSTDKPLANWEGIPIMPQAIAGQQVNQGMYAFKIPVDSGTIHSFYSDKLKSLGWNLEDDQLLGMKFTKDKSILLVTFAPATDMESWVVTLVLAS
jgi:hypothetical protein